MKLILSPQQSGIVPSFSKAGDVLTINGLSFDFGGIPDGGYLPFGAVDSDWITGPVRRVDGVLEINVMFPIPDIDYPDTPEAREVTHPSPIYVTVDGAIQLPQYVPAPESPEDPNSPEEEEV